MLPRQAKLNEKIERYKVFWNGGQAKRPIMAFDVGGFHFFERYEGMRQATSNILVPEKMDPKNFLADYEKFYEYSLKTEDDGLRGVCPIAAVPWLEIILGCPHKISGNSIWALEKKASFEALDGIKLPEDNPWLLKYLEFLSALNNRFKDIAPASQPLIRGPSDLHGALRGHEVALIDLMTRQEESKKLLENLTSSLIDFFNRQYEVLDTFAGGYFQEQYMVWAPDKIIRFQEDATANYSPKLYEEFLLEQDRRIAAAFPYALMHLHNSSLFILDLILQNEEINCFEINKDATGMDVKAELPYLQMIQEKGRSLVMRGAYTLEELSLIKNHLDPAKLLMQTVLSDLKELNPYKEEIDRLWG